MHIQAARLLQVGAVVRVLGADFRANLAELGVEHKWRKRLRRNAQKMRDDLLNHFFEHRLPAG